ncbi:MAG: alpha-2-macroglobulin [Tannerellaceae bacterium]|nr:alpha-2-macroglobulin [Tannerellaceae bacterium]
MMLCIFVGISHNTKAQPYFDEHRTIQTLINQTKEALATDRDSLPSLIRQAETLAHTSADLPLAAFLHSMTAEMYHTFHLYNRRTFSRRTSIEGFIPEDIREWTPNLFTQKIKEELAASLRPADILQQTPTSRFYDVLEKGTDSPALRPTLYDFLAYRALGIQPSEEIYRELLAFRRSQPNPQAALAVELDYLRYIFGLGRGEKEILAYEASLDSLLNLHAHHDYCVEVAHAKLELLQQKSFSAETPDSLRALRYRLCREMPERFPQYARIGLIEKHLATMEEKELRAVSRRTVYPGESLGIELSYKNLREVTISLYRKQRKWEDIFLSYYPNNKEKPQEGTFVEDISFALLPVNTYTVCDTTLSLPMEKPGYYEYVVTSRGAPLRLTGRFYVSRLAVVSRQIASGQEADVYVTDYRSGKPIQGATVHYYAGNMQKPQELGTLQTNRYGLAAIPANKEVKACLVRLAEDEMPAELNIYAGNSQPEAEVQTRVSLFTDRGIYRPGQTVSFKGIAYTNREENPQVAAGQRFEVTLRDANGKDIATQSYTGNAFGSFSGEFTLPQNTPTGRFSLSVANVPVYIQVEEYKRPTFRIDFLSVKEDISFGDEVHIHGKAQTFSGALLTDGVVVYRILQRPFFFRPYPYPGSAAEKQVASGETSLHIDGNFVFAFRPQREGAHPLFSRQSYEIVVQITDGKGETQEARTVFSVGDRNLILSTNLPDMANKDTTTLRITAHTLNGEAVATRGTYAVFILEDTQTEGTYTEGRKALEGTFSTDGTRNGISLSGLPSGRMRLRLSASDSQGREVNEQQDVVLYSSADKRPPVFSPTWLPVYFYECLPGGEALVRFGSSFKNVYLLYEVFGNGQNLVRRQMKLSNEIVTFRIPFPDSSQDALVVFFTFIKNGQLYTQQATLVRKRPDKALHIRTETFRDKLLPGSRESLTFRITDAQFHAVSSEVLAGMYDASLDPIRPFIWRFSLPSPPIPYYNRFAAGRGLGRGYDSDIVSAERMETPSFSFDRLDWQGALNIPSPHSPLYYSGRGNIAMEMSAESKQIEADAASGYAQETPPPPPALRTDFRETAFFYPALQTDPEGNVALNFTLPESNTTWKLQILAHTPDMKYGLSSHTITTQKPLMTLPNLPRYIRQGDEVQVSAQIINLLAEATVGQARLEVFNPSSGELLLPVYRQPFELSAGGTTTVSWPVSLYDPIEQVGIRIIADLETVSDGEQHILPVLADRILLTETTPFYLADEEEKQVKVSVPPVSSTLQPYRMTLEFSNNPVWYAIQALPTISEPDNDDAVSLFASYYSRALTASIARSNPRLKTDSALLSAPEPNEELKDLLQLQHEDGGWGWFKGFHPSRDITLYLLEGMAQLVHLNVVQYNRQEKEMQIKAIRYLDKLIGEDYNRLRKSGVSLHSYQPTPQQVRYLYVRSAYRDIPEAAEAQDAIRYYTEQGEKYWQKFALYEKGETALLMHRNGNKKIAGDILKQLRKTAVTSPEKGMYWPNNRREQNFFLSPIDVHCLLTTVFQTLDAPSTETDRLRQWLLNRKQTQNWESTPSTANAIYCLLNNGSDLTAKTNETTIQWGDKTFHTSAQNTVVGYIKESVNGEDLTPALQTVTLHKEGKSPAWGAVFYQYFESIGKVNKQGGALGIEKKLFVETNNGKQRQITPVDADRPLKVGDKVIVRLTLRTDRDMDYVCLKDLRSGCLEPAVQRSGIMFTDGLLCYHSPKDASEHFFFDHLPAGTHVLEYATYVSRSGRYTGGISTLQCMYAPEFVSHTEGNILFVLPQ